MLLKERGVAFPPLLLAPCETLSRKALSNLRPRLETVMGHAKPRIASGYSVIPRKMSPLSGGWKNIIALSNLDLAANKYKE